MPVVRVSLLAGRSSQVKQKISEDITKSVAKHAGSNPEHIYVVFEDVEPQNWAAGGTLLSKGIDKD